MKMNQKFCGNFLNTSLERVLSVKDQNFLFQTLTLISSLTTLIVEDIIKIDYFHYLLSS